MKNKRLTILAINPGTRYIGIAVLKGTVLLDWSVKVVKSKQSASKRLKMASIIDRLVDGYEPDIIAVKRLHSSRSSQALDQFCHDVETTAAANDIRFAQYSIDDVEQFFVPEENINKVKLAELICKKHPVLRRELKREKNNLNPYHIRMFEAVALGTMAQVTASKTN